MNIKTLRRVINQRNAWRSTYECQDRFVTNLVTYSAPAMQRTNSTKFGLSNNRKTDGNPVVKVTYCCILAVRAENCAGETVSGFD